MENVQNAQYSTAETTHDAVRPRVSDELTDIIVHHEADALEKAGKVIEAIGGKIHGEHLTPEYTGIVTLPDKEESNV